ncbi:MAG: phage baseplate assembly protein V [Cyanobacteria bacterium P01_H01_bin.26]
MNFFGKYRGKVTANKDPLNLGRVQVSVPAIFGDEKNSWALPCTPYAGKDIGLFMIPPIQTNVWVEFEGGDPDYPIWSGCFWGEKELPKNAQVSDPDKVQIFQTAGITLTLSNLEEKSVKKGITLEVTKPVVEKPLTLVFNKDGIELNNNDITTAKLLADTIELKNGDATLITLAKDSIQLKEQSIEIKLTQNSIELVCNPASVKLSTSAGIALANNPASAKLSSSGIELSSTPASVKVAASGVEANSGGLGAIKISPASVNVNSGALEVT